MPAAPSSQITGITATTVEVYFRHTEILMTRHTKIFDTWTAFAHFRTAKHPTSAHRSTIFLTGDWMQVSWSPPPSTHLLRYEVYYQTLDMSGPRSVIAVPGDLVSDTFQQSITGLSTGTPYRISVRAGNLYDFGPFTNLSVTPFAAPTVAPASATASLHPELSQSVAIVSWAPVDFADFYKVSFVPHAAACFACAFSFPHISTKARIPDTKHKNMHEFAD